MSRLSPHSKKSVATLKQFEDQAVTNFMEGVSYVINPIDTLRIVAASSIFGEPSYYRDSGLGSSSYLSNISNLRGSVIGDLFEDKDTTIDVFTKAIRSSLDFDFEKTLELAVELRKTYNMRLNPAVIYIEASVHSGRKEFTKKNPGKFKNFGETIIQRPDDMKNMFDYYMFLNGTKNNLPNVVKRVWAKKLNNLSPYHANKYKSKGLIDLVRISHPAPTPVISELMETGTVEVCEEDKTWETLRSEGRSWEEILETIRVPHMALLRNLRGIFTEVEEDSTFAKEVLADLKAGVSKGKQFPFRYYSAYNVLENADIKHKVLVRDALEECIDIAMNNFPKLDGKVMCLSDNSGSAWGSFNSEYGSVTVADIANLSSVMTAYNSDEGYVGTFGDRLETKDISKRNGILSQHREVGKIGQTVGVSTENGIWIFFDNAIKNKESFDHIFIYSDMQAGHGGLYGTDPRQYSDYLYKQNFAYIDILKLVTVYRKKVNPKVDVYSVQVAGYNNSVLPENLYRTSILSGWTGRETIYAKKLAEVWDSVENSSQ